MKRAALYLRISSDRNSDGLAVDRQRFDCERIIKERGWTLTEEYVDNSISASSRKVNRPAYDRMVEDYAAGKFDALVCWDLDRLTRQPRQLEDWIDLAEDRGLTIVTANGEADLTTDGGRSYARIKAALSRGEIERKSARHKVANEQKRRNGLPTPGPRVYGWENDRMTHRADEIAVIRESTEKILKGASLNSICADLNARGIPTTKGSYWRSVQLKNVLLRPRNAGLIERDGELVDSLIPPAVTRQDWDTMKAILAENVNHAGVGRPSTKHWMTGLASCGLCGSPLRIKTISKGTRGSSTHYACESKIYKKKHAAPGRHVTIAASILEETVKYRMYREANIRAREGSETQDAVDLKALEADLAGARADNREASEAYFVPGINKAAVRSRIAVTEARVAELEQKKVEALADSAELSQAAALMADVHNEGASVQFTGAWIEWWEKLTVEARRTVVRGTLHPTVKLGGRGADRVIFAED